MGYCRLDFCPDAIAGVAKLPLGVWITILGIDKLRLLLRRLRVL